MKFDIVFVTYNSEKWIDNCINSIRKSNYNLENLNLIFVDNNSKDKTIEKLEEYKNKYSKTFGSFIIKETHRNLGFGKGNNIGAKLGNSPYIFFFNVDTEVNEDTFSKLEERINNSSDEFGVFELAQRPYEHPKYYDPITGETSWASGACVVFKREVFELVKGWDKNIFMYCEDVEISWNVRKHGYKIKYLYDVIINHYTYAKEGEIKYTQYVYGLIGNWYIRSKYGQLRNFLRGCQYMYNVGFKRNTTPVFMEKSVRRKAKRKIRCSFFKLFFKYLFINLTTNKGNFQPQFINAIDYEVNKENPFFVQSDYETDSLVSIIVRTCNRKDALRENLISIRNQTYKNIEVVVVEDGPATAEEMIKEEFSDMNIVYSATGKNVGRSKVANLAMTKAKGKYLNFLDDDDLFYPDHVETLVKAIETHNCDAAYTGSFETQVNVLNKNPYKYEVKYILNFFSKPYNKERLYQVNLFPIQTVLFKKELFKECGGIDESIDALEDWDFWVRLSLKHHFYRVKHTTSIFRTPFDIEERNRRMEFLNSSVDYLVNKFADYKPEMTAADYNSKE